MIFFAKTDAYDLGLIVISSEQLRAERLLVAELLILSLLTTGTAWSDETAITDNTELISIEICSIFLFKLYTNCITNLINKLFTLIC